MPVHFHTFDTILDTSTDASVPPLLVPPTLSANHRNGVSARHWHNRYIAWQARERKQREEREKLEAEMKRIFGDDDGGAEDDGLRVKMLEYFSGLDFIS